MKAPLSPNLLFILTDQQRLDTLRCYGNEIVEAPHLNRLAEGSFVFRNAYCAQPVCTPSRGTMMTGLWPHTHGARTLNVPLPEESRTMAEIVPTQYRRANIGKWHLGNEVWEQHGFEEWISVMDRYRPHYTKAEYLERFSDYHHFLIENGYTPDESTKDGTKIFSREFSAALAEPYTKASFVGQKAAEFISGHDQSHPFLLSVSFFEPHPPTFGPLNRLYDPDTLPLPETFHNPPGPDTQSKARERAEGFQKKGYYNYPLKSIWDWQRIRANYYGLITLVDRAVGRILQALEDSGQSENTIVVFTSDHGEMLGSHALFKKGLLYEEAVKVPLLIRVPWLSGSQQMIEGRVSHIDLVPTLLELMGQPVPDHLQGRSRVSVLCGEESLEDPIFIEWNDDNEPGTQSRSVITPDGWKLNLHQDDTCSLFDLNSDPHELKNLFNESDQQGRIREMAGLIHNFQNVTGDTLALKDI